MKVVAGTCCCPIALDHFDVGSFCPGRPITWQACTHYWELKVLIGTRSSNQKDVSSFPILSKKKIYGIPNKHDHPKDSTNLHAH